MKNYASKGKRIGLLLAMLFITSWMFAQVTVTGNVRDERDEGAIGATVLLVGSQKGTITDSEGNFKLSVPNAQTAVLQISYVGYETQTIPLKGKTRIRVILKEEANALNEVMVVAYGTQKKETLTGSYLFCQNGCLAPLSQCKHRYVSCRTNHRPFFRRHKRTTGQGRPGNLHSRSRFIDRKCFGSAHIGRRSRTFLFPDGPQ